MKSKNYRYNTICKNCGKYIKKNEKGLHKKCQPRLMASRFLCGMCKKYKPYDDFGRDKSKKYGIRFNCKECRRKKDNGN